MNYKQHSEKRIRELVPSKFKIPVALPLPVKYDGIAYYFGPQSEIVADFDEGVNTGDGFRIRGWGRIQYMKELGKTPEQLQDECAYYIQDAINAYSEIQLQDVMQAIHMVFTEAGIFTKDTYYEAFNKVAERYNFLQPYSSQTEELYQLIWDYIK